MGIFEGLGVAEAADVAAELATIAKHDRPRRDDDPVQ
jgi:hypothetical protein